MAENDATGETASAAALQLQMDGMQKLLDTQLQIMQLQATAARNTAPAGNNDPSTSQPLQAQSQAATIKRSYFHKLTGVMIGFFITWGRGNIWGCSG